MRPSPVRLRFTARDSNAPTSQGAREWEPRGIPQYPVAWEDQGRRQGWVRCCLWEVSRSCPCTD